MIGRGGKKGDPGFHAPGKRTDWGKKSGRGREILYMGGGD